MADPEPGQVEIDGGDSLPEPSLHDFSPLDLTNEARNMYGLRHQDYQRYGQYCTRRIHKLRKTAGFLQGKKKFVKKEVEPENASSVRSVHIVLFQAERCWSQFMLLKRDSASEARKKHHAIRKLKKAAQYAATLNDICQHLVQEKRAIDSAKKQKSVLDERAALETSAYAATMKGFVAFEQQDWADAANSLSEARSIYEGLAKSASSQREELLMQAGMDSIDPNLKYSLYNLRGSGKDEDVGNLLDMLSGSGGQNEMVQSKVQSLLSQKLSEKAHEMSSIEFRKQQIPVRNEKLVQAILRATEAEKLLENAGSNSNSDEADEKLLKTYESVLAAWWEAQTLAEGDLREDELATAKVKSSKSNETTGQLKAVLSYVAFCRIMRTVDRDMVLMRGLERRLKANETLGTQPGGDGEGRKKKRQFKKGASASHLSGTARREDLVSLWDTVVQNYMETKNLPLIESDAAMLTIVAGKTAMARANKCLQLSMITGDPVPSLALLNRALSLLSSTKSELDSALRRVGKLPTAEEDRASITAMKEQSEDIERLVRLERTRLRARAVEAEQSGLSKAANQLSGIKIDSTAVENKQTPLLIDRLEDPNFVPDPRNLVDFPPNFVPVPCKPLFFDLAAGHIEYPLDRIAARGKKQAEEAKAAGGITGWLGGLWSKK